MNKYHQSFGLFLKETRDLPNIIIGMTGGMWCTTILMNLYSPLASILGGLIVFLSVPFGVGVAMQWPKAARFIATGLIIIFLLNLAFLLSI
jgi:hypothetical protein